jgi:hypothetical protein
MLYPVVRYVKIFCKDVNYDNLPQNKLVEASDLYSAIVLSGTDSPN